MEKEKLREYQRKWRENNLDKARESHREWRRNHREERNAERKKMYNNLKAFGKDKKWLMQKVKDSGYSDIKDIFLLICNSEGKVTIYEKDS